MSRWMLLALGGLLAGIIGEVWLVRAHSEKYSLSDDVRGAMTYLNDIRTAEDRCHAILGHYLALSELAHEDCSAIGSIVERAERDGYRLEIEADVSEYTIKVLPATTAKLISLYSDQEGKTRIGTRDKPASRTSALLR